MSDLRTTPAIVTYVRNGKPVTITVTDSRYGSPPPQIRVSRATAYRLGLPFWACRRAYVGLPVTLRVGADDRVYAIEVRT